MFALKIIICAILVLCGFFLLIASYNEYASKGCDLTKFICGTATGAALFALAFWAAAV